MTKKWKIKANGTKFVQVTFTTRRKTRPSINGHRIPQIEDAKYLELYLDRKLYCRKLLPSENIGLQLKKMYWLLDSKSQLSTENKLLLCKAILKPIWAYDIKL
jgi:hypothetical protein